MRQSDQELRPLLDTKSRKILVPLNELSLNVWISLKFIWFMTINKIQVEFEKGGYASIWTGVIAPGISQNIWFPLKFIWYMAINKKQVEFTKGGCASIWTRAIALIDLRNAKYMVSAEIYMVHDPQ